MNPIDLARAFRDGRVRAAAPPEAGLAHRPVPIVAERALLTRKSLLVFTSQSVIKVRRPIMVDGFDQSVPSVRYGMTGHERTVGRRIAPEVYYDDLVLRVAAAHPQHDTTTRAALATASPSIDPGPTLELVPGLVEGEPVVAMVRLPEDRRADHLLASRWVTPELFDPAMVRLATFHAESDPHPHAPAADPAHFIPQVRDLVMRVATVATPSECRHLEAETLGWVEQLAGTLAHRVMEGRVRDIHGEVALEHLFIGEDGTPAFIDPDDGLPEAHVMDTGEEVMRLALELDLLASPAFSDRVLETYATATADGTLRRVARLFKRLAALRFAADAAVLHAESPPDARDEDARARARFFIDATLARP